MKRFLFLFLSFIISGISLNASEAGAKTTADINARLEPHGRTALIISCKDGNLDICKDLLNQGADVHMTDKYGNNALLFAAIHGHIPIMKLLIEHKAAIRNKEDTYKDNRDFLNKCIDGVRAIGQKPKSLVISFIQQDTSSIGEAPKSPPARDESPVHARSL